MPFRKIYSCAYVGRNKIAHALLKNISVIDDAIPGRLSWVGIIIWPAGKSRGNGFTFGLSDGADDAGQSPYNSTSESLRREG